MIIRHYLQWSVCTLFILAVTSFSLIFIVSMTLLESLHNLIKTSTPLTMQNKNNWGSIPGTLKYEYKKSITLFNIVEDDSNSGLMTMNSIGPLNYTI